MRCAGTPSPLDSDMALADEWTSATTELGRLPISRQLHDIVVPQLFVLSTGLAAMRRQGEAAGNQALVRDLSDTASRALADLRAISRGHSVREGGQLSRVASRLRIATQTVSHLTGCTVDIEVDGDAQVSAALEDDVVAVAWEAVANAIRHGDAAHVSIEMAAVSGILSIVVTDNGEWRDALDDDGTGIGGLRERAAYWNGSAHITHKGDATRVIWRVPLVTSIHPLAER